MRPTPGSDGQVVDRDLPRGASRASRGRARGRARASTSWIRGAFVLASPPGRIASITSSVGASRISCQPPSESRRPAVGDVAVAVVRVLGEDRQHELVDRVAVRLVALRSVELAEPVADRPHPPRRRPLPALRDGEPAAGGRGRRRRCAAPSPRHIRARRRRSSSRAYGRAPETTRAALRRLESRAIRFGPTPHVQRSGRHVIPTSGAKGRQGSGIIARVFEVSRRLQVSTLDLCATTGMPPRHAPIHDRPIGSLWRIL